VDKTYISTLHVSLVKLTTNLDGEYVNVKLVTRSITNAHRIRSTMVNMP
jgi:hypothetical protein